MFCVQTTGCIGNPPPPRTLQRRVMTTNDGIELVVSINQAFFEKHGVLPQHLIYRRHIQHVRRLRVVPNSPSAIYPRGCVQRYHYCERARLISLRSAKKTGIPLEWVEADSTTDDRDLQEKIKTGHGGHFGRRNAQQLQNFLVSNTNGRLL